MVGRLRGACRGDGPAWAACSVQRAPQQVPAGGRDRAAGGWGRAGGRAGGISLELELGHHSLLDRQTLQAGRQAGSSQRGKQRGVKQQAPEARQHQRAAAALKAREGVAGGSGRRE